MDLPLEEPLDPAEAEAALSDFERGELSDECAELTELAELEQLADEIFSMSDLEDLGDSATASEAEAEANDDGKAVGRADGDFDMC